MTKSDISPKVLAGLNEKQIEAVTAVDGPVLILAGAGSGKTRALTHRIAYLITQGVRPENILAVTFTNKAAGEIKERVKKMVGDSRPTMGTFHSICVRILRREAEKLGYGKNFLIYDADDQKTLIKGVMKNLDLDTKRFNPLIMREKISKLKSELIGPEKFRDSAKDFMEKILAPIYVNYQESLKHVNAFDFDDLIFKTVELFRAYPAVLGKYQNFFRYILVDEYQDTNHSQYELINLLAKKHRNLFVIGDDYQSIYAWRQADIRNILDFEKDYPEVKTIMLEQNYRSTKNILAAAGNLILNNKNQKHKNLWTENPAGDNIFVKELQDQREEGNFIIETIKGHLRRGALLSDFTILYRTHAQSRAIEEAMLEHGFPYRIIGGVRFYERREIKDILSYLRLAFNPADAFSFSRVYNVPGRGIGKSTFEKIKSRLGSGGLIFESLKKIKDADDLAARQKNGFSDLAEMLEKFTDAARKMPLTKLISLILEKTDYKGYIDDGTQEGEARWENVREILTAAKKYDGPAAPEGLEKFLEEVSLIQDTDKLEEKTKAINLMTLHSVKGLEFPVIFMVGMEEGVFPHARSVFEPSELEEERRLCYVGITRAKQKLFITFCRQRLLYGNWQFNPPSRFLFEIPESVVSFSPLTEKSAKIESY